MTLPGHLESLFVGGDWVEPSGDERLTVVNPTTERELATVPAGTPGDVDRAVAAARAAFPAWSGTPAAERAATLSTDRGRAGRAPGRRSPG